MQRPIHLEGLCLSGLLDALHEALESLPQTSQVDSVVTPVVIRVEDKMNRILRLAKTRKQISFQGLLAKSSSRAEVIVSFLAVLELIKRREIRVFQEHLFGEIVISLLQTSSPPEEEDQSG
jgi:segregation and condensation protein A